MNDTEKWALNARVAREVFGLNVVCEDWPFEYEPDSCEPEPAHFVYLVDGKWRVRDSNPDWLAGYRPVYATEKRGWPPYEWDKQDSPGEHTAWVKAVPDYRDDPCDGRQVIKWLTEKRRLLVMLMRLDGSCYAWTGHLDAHGESIEHAAILVALKLARTERDAKVES